MTAPDWPYGWLLRLAQAATRDQAQDIAREALASGANPANVAAALAEYDELYACQVVTWVMCTCLPAGPTCDSCETEALRAATS